MGEVEIRMILSNDPLAARLDALEAQLTAFKHDHDVSHSDAVVALEARLRVLRSKIGDDVARGDHMAALGDELDRDLTGLNEQFTALIASAGRGS